jgi:hypothetical protein
LLALPRSCPEARTKFLPIKKADDGARRLERRHLEPPLQSPHAKAAAGGRSDARLDGGEVMFHAMHRALTFLPRIRIQALV